MGELEKVERRRIFQALLAVLQGFGTADEIADFLRGENIRGWREQAFHCPLAAIFKRETNCFDVSVSSGSVVMGGLGREGVVQCTSAMRDFVIKFDNGDYPDLDLFHADA